MSQVMFHTGQRLRVHPIAGLALAQRLVMGVSLAAMSFVSVAAQPGEPVIRKYYAESKPGTAPAPNK